MTVSSLADFLSPKLAPATIRTATPAALRNRAIAISQPTASAASDVSEALESDPMEAFDEPETIADDTVDADAIPERSSAWTLPLLCAGIAILACCLIIPAADDNRRLAYEKAKLSADLDQIKKQVDINGQFLKSVGEDPALLERLAQRQMKMVRDGTSVLDIADDGQAKGELSPYLLLNVPVPPAQPEYRPIGGHFAQLCRAPRSRLFIMGGALLAIACGLIMGEGTTAKPTAEQSAE